MKKILTVSCALGLALIASTALADTMEPTHPCVKPEKVDALSMNNYESCMAEFIASQKSSIANHEAALRKAEAAMECKSDMDSK